MANKVFGFTSLTGGGLGALDSIDGSVITAGDLAYGTDGTDHYDFVCVGDSAAESSPDVIAPDANAGVKRWHRRHDESKAYRATTPTNGNMAEVDADGDVVDSGLASSIFDDLGTLTGDKGLIPVVNSAESGYSMTPLSNRNVLTNGNFVVSQRGVSFTSATTPANSDDTYLLDRWVLLSDGNDIVDITKSTERPATKFLNSIAFDVETANKKFGILQIIENKDSEYLIGDTVTFSFYAKVSAITKLDNIKAAIISWSSTADTVTSDIVSAWENEGTEPTLAANWTYENTPSNLGVTTSWIRYTITATIDTASTANIGVFIWSDVTDTTAGDFLYITGCQLELGSVATSFEFRSYVLELTLCQRYLQRFVGESGSSAYMALSFIGSSSGTTVTRFILPYKVTPRIAPTGIVSVMSNASIVVGAGSLDFTSVAFVGSNSVGLIVDVTHGTYTAGTPVFLLMSGTDYIDITEVEI